MSNIQIYYYLPYCGLKKCYYLLLVCIFLIPIYKLVHISYGSSKVIKYNKNGNGILYINLKKSYSLINKQKKVSNLKSSIDFHIDNFCVLDANDCNKNYDTYGTDINSNIFRTDKDLINIQNEINKNVRKSFNEKKFEKIFENKIKHSINSTNPPYVFHPIYSHAHIKKQHRFKIKKYENLFSYLNKMHLYDNNYLLPTCQINETIEYMLKVHEPSFIRRMLHIIRDNERINMYELDLFSDLISRFLVEINGTILSSLLALKHLVSMHVGGGNHHSKIARGDGFCIFNDIAIAVHFLLSNKLIKNVIILDVDVHQGDGTAEIFKNSKNVKTISLHCKNNYPSQKKKSTIDVELDPYIKDDEYLAIYQNILNNIKKEESSIIFYLAGVDISKDDDLGLLLISDDGIYKRDYMTYKMSIEANIPVVTLLAGGYNECEETLTQKHLLSFRAAKEIWNYAKK